MSQHPFPLMPPVMPCRRADIETHLMPDGSCLLYDSATTEAHVLDVVGAFVWEYCDGTLTPDQIAAELASVLPEAPNLRADALRMIAEFETAGLFTPSGGADDAATGQKENA